MFGKNNTYLHLPQTSQHNEIQDFLSAHNYLIATNNAPVLEAASLYNDFNHIDVVNGLNGVVVDHSTTMVNAFPKKQSSAKKDRHSKIYTVHGPRDRRVRLSIGIARKFFDLQELLNFDKPSKTLDWLLTKSKEAIKDLVNLKSGKTTTTSSNSDVEVGDLACEINGNSSLKGKSVVVNSHNKCKGAKESIVKESRVKARARARERTKEKMCIKAQLNEATRNYKGCDWNNQVQFDQATNILHCPITSNYEDLIQESIVNKKKMKQYPPMLGFNQQNLGSIASANATENWDYSNFASQSNQLCAMLDQHKFIN